MYIREGGGGLDVVVLAHVTADVCLDEQKNTSRFVCLQNQPSYRSVVF